MALIVSVGLNLGFLGFFKYFNFFIDSFSSMMSTMGLPVSDTTLQILLPPGISFYTFQAVAYIVDVYQRRLKPADSLVDYALFISLFPHLIAGPIQRPSHLLPQVQAARVFEIDSFYSGLQLIAMGLFRKVVIADNCALLADAAFSGKLGEPNLAVLADRRLCVRVADLRRLQRLQRHCARLGAADGVPFHGELQTAVPRHQPAGFLAALAHQPEYLAARLSIHLARR